MYRISRDRHKLTTKAIYKSALPQRFQLQSTSLRPCYTGFAVVGLKPVHERSLPSFRSQNLTEPVVHKLNSEGAPDAKSVQHGILATCCDTTADAGNDSSKSQTLYHRPSAQPAWNTLGGAVARHIRFEKASFHTPGHKGKLAQLVGETGSEPSTISPNCPVSTNSRIPRACSPI